MGAGSFDNGAASSHLPSPTTPLHRREWSSLGVSDYAMVLVVSPLILASRQLPRRLLQLPLCHCSKLPRKPHEHLAGDLSFHFTRTNQQRSALAVGIRSVAVTTKVARPDLSAENQRLLYP